MTDKMLTPDVSAYADVEGLFEDKPGRGGTYLSIFNHQICQRSKSFDTEEEATTNLLALQATDQGWTGPHKTTNPKNKQDRWSNSKPYDRLIARVGDISKHTKEFKAESGGGKVTNWDLTFLTGGKRLTLQLVWCDPILKRFLKVSPNIDFTRPILISAFKSMRTGEAKQAVSFKQYTGDLNDLVAFKNVDGWTKVEEYWKPDKVDSKGLALEGSKRIGADGSELPPPVQDPEDDSWDYKAQNNFLATRFRDNILPTIKALATQYGLDNPDTEGEELLHSGPPQNDTPVTERPFIVAFTTMADAATGGHVARVKELAQACGFDPNFATQKLLEADLTELTDEAARYVIYKLEQRLQKQTGEVVAPVPPPPPPPPPVVEEEDLWDPGPVPTAVPAAKAPDNDDIDW